MGADHQENISVPPPVRVVNLAKAYQSAGAPLPVFGGINFELAPGERVAVVGASGAGKSSLLHLLGGLDRPSSGTVFYGVQDLYALPEADLARFRNRHIAFVWQMNSLLGEFTAAENVCMPLFIRGAAPDEARRRALECLEAVGLGARASHRPRELSGGEQQRVSLARALAGSPTVLLADEPTGNLDYRTAESVSMLLAELSRKIGFTTVVATHNLEFARSCDRVLQLEKGAVV